MPYKYRGVIRLTSQEKREIKEKKILAEFSRTSHLYEYDTITFSLMGAKHFGFPVYWNICKAGHIGEFSLRGECKTCRAISKGIRDAKIRGGLINKLTEEEKIQIANLYRYARKLARETGEPHHVDHIKPLSAGGEHHPSNLRVILAKDNLKKGSKYKGKDRLYKDDEKMEIATKIQTEKDKRSGEIQSNQDNSPPEKNKNNRKSLIGRLLSSFPRLT
jgi:hypothetical protein